jgi:hypothetical protein
VQLSKAGKKEKSGGREREETNTLYLLLICLERKERPTGAVSKIKHKFLILSSQTKGGGGVCCACVSVHTPRCSFWSQPRVVTTTKGRNDRTLEQTPSFNKKKEAIQFQSKEESGIHPIIPLHPPVVVVHHRPFHHHPRSQNQIVEQISQDRVLLLQPLLLFLLLLLLLLLQGAIVIVVVVVVRSSRSSRRSSSTVSPRCSCRFVVFSLLLLQTQQH